jgi:hypothetical protein
MPTINDFIQSVATDHLTDATSSIHDLLGQRVLQALDTRKQEIAGALFQAKDEMTENA